MMTPQEMIEVLSAHIDGQAVEFRKHDELKWNPVGKPCWDFDNYNYRVKPVPLEFWINTYGDGHYYIYHSFTDARGTIPKDCKAECRTIHVREVLDDTP